MSKYRLTITRTDQKPVVLIPGGKAERDLVEDIVNRVGMFRTKAQLRAAIEAALHEAKGEVIPL